MEIIFLKITRDLLEKGKLLLILEVDLLSFPSPNIKTINLCLWFLVHPILKPEPYYKKRSISDTLEFEWIR